MTSSNKIIKYEVRIHSDGSEHWYLDGLRHKVGGPAVTYLDGREWWYQFGKCHREDGPAVTFSAKSKMWYLNGVHMLEHEFNARQNSEFPYGKLIEVDGRKYRLVDE